MSTCPKCNGEQHCPCASCADRSAGKVVWIWVDGEWIKCGHCGHTMNADAWMDWDYNQYKKQREAKESVT